MPTETKYLSEVLGEQRMQDLVELCKEDIRRDGFGYGSGLDGWALFGHWLECRYQECETRVKDLKSPRWL